MIWTEKKRLSKLTDNVVTALSNNFMLISKIIKSEEFNGTWKKKSNRPHKNFNLNTFNSTLKIEFVDSINSYAVFNRNCRNYYTSYDI